MEGFPSESFYYRDEAGLYDLLKKRRRSRKSNGDKIKVRNTDAKWKGTLTKGKAALPAETRSRRARGLTTRTDPLHRVCRAKTGDGRNRSSALSAKSGSRGICQPTSGTTEH